MHNLIISWVPCILFGLLGLMLNSLSVVIIGGLFSISIVTACLVKDLAPKGLEIWEYLRDYKL